eukprot:GHVH01012098.1.p1 GENE.GHVH01012098.1~~GHVH01012098.1.p1  ORF type:complete len:206 (-),score=25.56 GHVH01012098.1:133-750(-)
MGLEQRKKDSVTSGGKQDAKVDTSPSGGNVVLLLLISLCCSCIAIFLFNPAGINSKIADLVLPYIPPSLVDQFDSFQLSATAKDLSFPLDPVEKLHWTILTKGGDQASRAITAKDNVRLHVKGLLADGSEFWSTGNPPTDGHFDTEIGANMLITGFDQGVRGMVVGELRRIYIPWSQGYGANGMPPTIPAHSDLIFEVQLHSFNN